MSVKTKLTDAMDKLGKTNGHTCPASQDPMVPLIHEYHVATLGESYFKARRDKAKKKLDEALTDVQRDKLHKSAKNVIKSEVSESVEISLTDPYTLSVDLKNGASYVDMTALKNTLMKDHHFTADMVEKLIESSTKRRDPSQSWKVTER